MKPFCLPPLSLSCPSIPGETCRGVCTPSAKGISYMIEIWSREVRTQLTERLGSFQLWTHSAQIKSYCKTTCSCFLKLVILGLCLRVAFSVGYSDLISKFLLRMDIRNVSPVDIYVQAWTPSTFTETFYKALPHTRSCSLISPAPLVSLAQHPHQDPSWSGEATHRNRRLIWAYCGSPTQGYVIWKHCMF